MYLCTGGDYRSVEAGGGSGGSLWLECSRFDGDGMFTVDGGDGYGGALSAHGGGGAGGRFAIYYEWNDFVGELICQWYLQRVKKD